MLVERILEERGGITVRGMRMRERRTPWVVLVCVQIASMCLWDKKSGEVKNSGGRCVMDVRLILENRDIT